MTQLFLSVFIIFWASLSSASEWTINPAHSEILFEVHYLKWGEVSGRFYQFSGSLTLDGHDRPSELALTIKSSSLNTGNAMRDNHLRGSDFFQSKTHPHILFTSKDILKTGKDTYRVSGTLRIRDVAKVHTLDIRLSEVISDTWNFENRFVKFSTVIDRRDFKLTWNKTLRGESFLVGDAISVKGSFQLQPVKGSTPNSKHMIPDTAYIRQREKILRKEISADTSASAPILDAPVAKPAPAVASPLSQQNEKKSPALKSSGDKGFVWWTCYAVLGLFGFFGVILSGIYGKKTLIKIYLNHYEETGVIGYLSDAFFIGIVFIYSWAYWMIGWR